MESVDPTVVSHPTEPEPTGGTVVHQRPYLTDEQEAMRREHRKRVCCKLYLQGLTQLEIAERIGTTQQMVSKYLMAVRADWEMDRKRDAKALVSRELARLDLAESRYWEAWEKSGGKLVRVTVEKGSVDGKPTERRIEVTEDSPGDPRFLAGVLECIRMRCKLLGLEAPKQSVVTVVPVEVVAGLDLDVV